VCLKVNLNGLLVCGGLNYCHWRAKLAYLPEAKPFAGKHLGRWRLFAQLRAVLFPWASVRRECGADSRAPGLEFFALARRDFFFGLAWRFKAAVRVWRGRGCVKSWSGPLEAVLPQGCIDARWAVTLLNLRFTFDTLVARWRANLVPCRSECVGLLVDHGASNREFSVVWFKPLLSVGGACCWLRVGPRPWPGAFI